MRFIEINTGRYGVQGVGITSMTGILQNNGDIHLQVNYSNNTTEIISDGNGNPLNFRGAPSVPFVSILKATSSTTVNPSDYSIVIMDSASINQVNLEQPTSLQNKQITVKNIGTGTVTVQDANGYAINTGNFTVLVQQNQNQTFIWDEIGQMWWTL